MRKFILSIAFSALIRWALTALTFASLLAWSHHRFPAWMAFINVGLLLFLQAFDAVGLHCFDRLVNDLQAGIRRVVSESDDHRTEAYKQGFEQGQSEALRLAEVQQNLDYANLKASFGPEVE